MFSTTLEAGAVLAEELSETYGGEWSVSFERGPYGAFVCVNHRPSGSASIRSEVELIDRMTPGEFQDLVFSLLDPDVRADFEQGRAMLALIEELEGGLHS